MGFGGIFNSFKFELGDSPSEPIRGEAGDQNEDFRREGDSSNSPQRQASALFKLPLDIN